MERVTYSVGFKLNPTFIKATANRYLGPNSDEWVAALGRKDRDIHNCTLIWSCMQADVFNTDDLTTGDM